MAMSDDEPIENSNSEENFIDFYYESKRLVLDQEYAEGGKFILFFPLKLASEKWNEAKEFYQRNELPGILQVILCQIKTILCKLTQYMMNNCSLKYMVSTCYFTTNEAM